MSNVHRLYDPERQPIVPTLTAAHLAPLREHLRLLLEDGCHDNLELFGGVIADMAGLTMGEPLHDVVP